MYLLDTNVVINFLNSSVPPTVIQMLNGILDEQSNISVITKMETLGFNFKTVADQTTMETFISGSNVYEINYEVVIKTIDIRKSRKIDLPDAIIAATAIVNHFILLTSNVSDFKNIDGLRVIDPRSL